jgi:hypothetical protein
LAEVATSYVVTNAVDSARVAIDTSLGLEDTARGVAAGVVGTRVVVVAHPGRVGTAVNGVARGDHALAQVGTGLVDVAAAVPRVAGIGGAHVVVIAGELGVVAALDRVAGVSGTSVLVVASVGGVGTSGSVVARRDQTLVGNGTVVGSVDASLCVVAGVIRARLSIVAVHG